MLEILKFIFSHWIITGICFMWSIIITALLVQWKPVDINKNEN